MCHPIYARQKLMTCANTQEAKLSPCERCINGTGRQHVRKHPASISAVSSAWRAPVQIKTSIAPFLEPGSGALDLHVLLYRAQSSCREALLPAFCNFNLTHGCDTALSKTACT
eukprot:TRINITY_DN101798_c0_g1_i1.p1 TRINITY_DN101798_c0_g1~~TRINITY_DN101798_c0_g1_i1.p1  ORF type:complete len:113 (+),score=12.73 TRINITY_DN101798_c0_g1_i1:128-466(+)